MSLVTRAEGLYLTRRDKARLRKRGWLMLPDMVRTSAFVVHQVKGGHTEVVGAVSDKAHVKHVRARIGTAYSQGNRLVRLEDLMDLKQLCWKTGRAKATISGGWMKSDDFPKHVRRFGMSKVWLWPDVHEWMERHGLTIVKAGD